ncbi:hypothetical protein COR50_18350 [Chitinophaga caeni]|uniref:Tetracycline regulation of excision, RteC n=1 Tax=Chitinophaga caeni TaxID=2029983 RepID=A0A291QYM5_9BACT|nr:RteC domain-containing protein [Chitinophaga caeni]ATL48972.1 hypothetical protein COR50_18350 [Chitinophaga caeni]
METLFNELHQQVEGALNDLCGSATDVDLTQIEEAITIINQSLYALRRPLVDFEFDNPEDEIVFFKKDLPRLQSKLIYYVSLAGIEFRKPEGAKETLVQYYREELDKITIWFEEHREYYEYYRADSSHLDKYYFIRGARNIRSTFSCVFDPHFCPAVCYVYAKIIAHNQLQKHLNKQLDVLLGVAQGVTFPGEFGIRWTDSRAALEELTYAWYFKGSFNNGQVEIKKLYEALCTFFGISPGNIYKSKQDFYGRTNISAYLDVLSKRYKEGMVDSE